MTETQDILKNRNFFLLWLGQIISQFGDRLNQMALIALVYLKFPGSTFALAKLLSFTIIPAFIISPIAGAYVDRWDRRKTMIVCDISRALLVLLIPLIFIEWQHFYAIYITVFLIFSMSCFFIPSKLSIIPDIVPQEKLLIANSLTTMTALIAVVLGVGIGGPLVEIIGTKGGFYIDALTYLVSASMITCITLDKTKATRQSAGLREVIAIEKSIFTDIKEGAIYIASHKDVRFVLITLFVLMSAAGALYVVSIVFIQETLASMTKHLGVLGIFLGIGFFIGSLGYGRSGQKLSKQMVMYGGLGFCGIFIALFSFLVNKLANIWVAASLIALLGIFIGPIIISANTLVHEVSSDKMRGRTFSALGIVMNLGFLIFMFLASTLAEFLGNFLILLSIGIVLAVYGIVGIIVLSLDGKRLKA